MLKNKKTNIKTSKAKKTPEKKISKPPEQHPRFKESDKPFTLNRRNTQQPERRDGADRRQKNIPVAADQRVCQRRAKVNRRRQIDPTTCERDYTLAEIEFMNAIEEYKRASGRMFPTCSEVLEVLQKLGYEKRAAPIPPPIMEPTLVPDIVPSLAAF